MVKQKTTILPDEIQRFARIANEWWQSEGPNKFLHAMNPVRMAYICSQLRDHFCLEGEPLNLSPLHILDVGCGGGIATAPLARLKANITGIDATLENIEIAKQYARDHQLEIDYQCDPLEAFAERTPQKFDVILMLELIEHVQQPATLIEAAAHCLKPNGLLILSTINRTLPSFLMAKVMAEYVVCAVPRGTHDWQKFYKPSEVMHYLQAASFELLDLKGLKFSPVKGTWSCTNDVQINYIMTVKKSADDNGSA